MKGNSPSAVLGFGVGVPGLVRECRRVVGGTCPGRVLQPRGRSYRRSVPTLAKKGADKSESIYKDTVNLPVTGFEQRANAVKREPELQRFWKENKVYEELSRNNAGETFTLHDGPPYANGSLHMGHALNKVLKDFINRYQLLRGRKSVFVPGWDCHGLPIELKVLQTMKSKERASSTPLQLRQRARDFALKTVQEQKLAFERLGVWADWEDPYLTLLPEYEAAQIGVFGEMFLRGHIYRGKKPVHWSPSSRTALAEAELEYPEEHVSRSCYAAFEVKDVTDCANSTVRQAFESAELRVAVWTTTPWTLPANRAVCVNADLDYSLVTTPARVTLVVASALVDTLAAKMETTLDTRATVKGSDLVGLVYKHPLEDDLFCRVIVGGDYITDEGGTGLVHTAPGHGQDDYQVGMREGLDIFAPVDGAGKFTEEAANGRFTGMNVLNDGNEAVIEFIRESGVLLIEEPYHHKYPYDWRTKKPTIFRATEQWFASVDGFREEVLNEIGRVKWLPAIGENRIRGMVQGRSDWCISRQRNWGVPIPVFYNEGTGEAVMTKEIIDAVQALFADKGSDAWYEMNADDILPEEYRGKGLVKGTDTMDVWFDSGTSWNAVANGREELSYPADLYLEGSDQHRGWFQSSLLTSVAARGSSPYKAVLTHGFVLDEKGLKMSKSIGNVVDPLEIVEGGKNKNANPAYGADVLRLWVSSVDYSGDVLIGSGIIRQVSDMYRKLRNTVRYLAGNIHDFDILKDSIPFERLPSLDRYILRRVGELDSEIVEAYDSYNFSKVYQALQRFAVVDLSNFYLDIAKDRLYIPAPSGYRRRSCQTALHIILSHMVRWMAPVLPHMAEDLWQNMRGGRSGQSNSIFRSGWPEVSPTVLEPCEEEDAAWQILRKVRTEVNKCMEVARNEKFLGSSLEAKVILFSEDPGTTESVATLAAGVDSGNGVDELRYLLIVSDVELAATPSSVEECEFTLSSENALVRVGITRASGAKCERCWNYSRDVGTIEDHPALCGRCDEALRDAGIAVRPTAAAAAAASE